MKRACIGALAVLCGCSQGENDNDTWFTGGSLGSSATTPDTEPDSGAEDEDEGDGDGDEGDVGGSTGGDPTGPGGPTGGPATGGMSGETGGEETGMDEGDATTTGPFMPGNGQPMSGMYAHCYEPDVAACTASAPLCLMLDSMMDGFCTHDECDMPGDCDAAPLDGTAAPICFPAEDGGGSPVGLCALDCSSGRTCPAGMQCVENLSFGPDFPMNDICL